MIAEEELAKIEQEAASHQFYFTPRCAAKMCLEIRRLRDGLERVAFIRYDAQLMTLAAFDALTGGECTAAAIVADALRAGA